MRSRTVLMRIAVGMLAGIAVGAIISEATFFFLRSGADRSAKAIELVIPDGTAKRMASGQAQPVLPESMTFVVGDRLLVRNQDSANHQLGPLFIPAGSSATLILDTPQQYAAACSFQPSKLFGIDVQPALTPATRAVGILQAGVPLGFIFILYGLFALPRRESKAP